MNAHKAAVCPRRGWYVIRAVDTDHAVCQCDVPDCVRPTNIVFVLAHQWLDEEWTVCVPCARRLCSAWKDKIDAMCSKLTERCHQRDRWVDGPSWKTSAKGNSYIQIDGGVYVTVFRYKFSASHAKQYERWKFCMNDVYSQEYPTERDAQLAAFNKVFPAEVVNTTREHLAACPYA